MKSPDRYPQFASILILFGCVLLPSVGGMASVAVAQADEKRLATLIRLPMPLTAEGEAKAIASLESFAGRAQGAERPIVVLEFTRPSSPVVAADKEAALGRGTSFERGLGLARWLSGPKGNRVRSIAYLPESIQGHAVLIALACEEIAMNPAAEIGLAGVDDPSSEATILQAYLEIAARRGSFPPAAVRSMLDRTETLVRLDLDGGGVEYATIPELEIRLRPANAWNETQLVPANQMAKFTGQELRSWRWITHLVPEPDLLASVLKLDSTLQERPMFAETRTAMRSHLRGIVNSRQVDRIIRAIDEAIEKDKADLLLIDINSPGGNISESIRLAFYLANIPADRAEVVVYISGYARGDASLIALAADTLYMAPDATIGGDGESSISPADVEKRKDNLIELARNVGRFSGDIAGCMCPEMQVFQYTSANGRQTRAPAQWIEDDAKLPLWTQGPMVDYKEGLTADQALELGIANDRLVSLSAVGDAYGLGALPDETQTNTTEQVVEWIASQRWLSTFLFLIGLVLLVTEIQSPGLGVPGALAAVCFLFFFWLQLFQGTVEWLEILLIVGGVGCLAMEIFVLPGFGVFGVCGLLLLSLGLILAGQTFVIPTNAYQLDQMVQGLGQLGFGVLVLLGLLIGFRKQLSNLPMVRWFALQPPKPDRFLVSMEHRDEQRQSLLGRYGETMTPCNPYGKATIGDAVVDVVSEDAWIAADAPVEVVAIHNAQVIIKRRSF